MKLIRISAVWCTSCILTYPIWNQLKEHYPHFTFEEYDYDTDNEVIEKYQIGDILPVILVFNQDGEVTRMIGEKTFKEIQKILEQ